ncbi:MAG: transposase [Nitrolancea sp.]
MTERTNPNEKYPPRKRLRLQSEVYSERGLRAFLTITTDDRTSTFDDFGFAEECRGQLRAQSTEQSVAVLAYCFMPDHVHLLLQVDGDVGIIDFVGKFKSVTTRIWWSHGNQGRLWQRTFHDHLLRDSEDVGDYLTYILANPVRAGLVDEWSKYQFSGSFAYDLSEGLT